jgi:transposase InsO family protein
MLAGLPEVYKPMIMAIESSGVKICADSIKTKLLQEVKTMDTTAFYSNSKKQYNINIDKGQNKSKGPRCFHCNKYGHLSKNCWYKKKKTDNKDNGFIAAFSATTSNDALNWYVDSGASMHMTTHKEWLEDKTAPPVTSIRIANDKILRVECCGNVTIRVPDTRGNINKIQVRNVIYVPELSTNLISVSKMIKSGCNIQFNDNGCKISNKNGQKVADANLINNMYKLNIAYEKAQAMPAVTENDTYLWHQRMGHLNFSDMDKIPSCTTGVKLSPSNQNITCVSCIQGKQTRQPFPSEGSRATELLEVIHSDVCGPMQTASLGGARYFVTFIDDFSRKVHVYTIKSKADVLNKFIEYKARVENELNKKIKTLRTDNGKEYVNNNFNNYLKKFGILHQTTNPYTPEQNGLSERMNRTIIERSKCMVLNAQLQNNFWGEAVVTAAHIINRSPSRALSYVTPEEVWTNKKPDLSHIRIFGCNAMVHIPKERRQKLDPKSRKLIFVGYSDCVKGYRFIDPKTKMTVTSRDVVFLEATVKRDIVNNESVPEKEETSINERKTSTLELKSKVMSCSKMELNLPESKIVYLPLSEENANEEKDDIGEDNDSVKIDELNTMSLNDVLLSSPASVYSDPNDESYNPEESMDIPEIKKDLRPRRRDEFYEPNPPQENTSFMCMNGESAMSILDKDPQSLSEALESNKADQWIHAMGRIKIKK